MDLMCEGACTYSLLGSRKEHAFADFQWGVADPIIVSVEIVSVLCAGPMCCYILKLLINDDPQDIGPLFWALRSCSLGKCSYLGFQMAPSAEISPIQMGDEWLSPS